MMAGAIIRALLLADGTTAALIGTRVHPAADVPEGAIRPRIVYQVTADAPDRDLNGRSAGRIAAVALDVVGNTYADVQTLLDRLDVVAYAAIGTTVLSRLISAAEADTLADEISGPIDLDDGQAFVGSATINLYYGS